jgi:predicted dehydrogenase
VVGLGLIGQVVHVPNLMRLGDSFVVTHVSDLSKSLMEAVAASLPGTPRRSLDAAHLCVDPHVDAVLLLTPGAHAPLAEVALLAGKHVISEKPFCVTQAEAVRLDRIASERGLTLQVAYMKAYDPAIPAARDAIERIGDVQLVSVEVRHPTHENQIGALDYRTASDVDPSVVRAAEAAEELESVAALGSVPVGIDHLYRWVLLGSVIHELSALRALGFPPPARWEHVQVWPFDPSDGTADPPSLAATAQLEGGAILRLQWLWLPDYPRYEETISVVGSAGAIHLDMPQPYGPNVPARLHVRGPDGHDVVLDDGRQHRDSGFLEELRVFHAAVTSGASMPTGAEEAREDTASLQAFVADVAARHGIEVGGEAAGAGSGTMRS